ncbi:hypothetical protein ACIRD2_03370 [Streptomyces sp. NPDC093595]|uniref:hypothetical protein n=1 Tax=Streptomyces sp. NPDC093595 TaxID=3366045 RepID=UPI003821247C
MNDTRGESGMEAPAPNKNRDSASPEPLPERLVRDMDRDALSQLVREVNADGQGISFGKMAERATAAGAPVSKPYFQKMATNSVASAPNPQQLAGLAAGLGKPLSLVQRAAAIQYLAYEATELSGYDDETRIIVAHLSGMDPREKRRWRAMIEADEQAKRDHP